MGRKLFVDGNWKCNGTSEEVKKIVSILNEAEVPSEDAVENTENLKFRERNTRIE
ncbi:hypothetical protein HHK36_011011 [Tetracentron sinense]|uniref:Triosephosphate isomerase n=1 Tax=Tetracentron sinense TaxID=13715 RepID=A0A835DK30_TETSI|nr:hypothetical protein HHK36_011011 [Tetracentron sinense]